MSNHEHPTSTATVEARVAEAHRRISAALAALEDEQSRVAQECHRMTATLRALMDEQEMLARRRSQLVDEMRALTDDRPGSAGHRPGSPSRPVRRAGGDPGS